MSIILWGQSTQPRLLGLHDMQVSYRNLAELHEYTLAKHRLQLQHLQGVIESRLLNVVDKVTESITYTQKKSARSFPVKPLCFFSSSWRLAWRLSVNLGMPRVWFVG